MSKSDEATDADLVRATVAGNDAAFALLVTRHKDSIYCLLRRHTGHSDEAYEATQEAFIAAWRALERYDPQRPFYVWLRTIALNKARDRNRRRVVRRMVFGTEALDFAAAASAPDQTPGAEAQVLARQQLLRLEQAIGHLPIALKEPLLLVAFDGCTHSQAAEVLGLSVKAIEMRLYRARKMLAAHLGDDF
ncbi:MAG: RNA polymerase sigma factor [Steroidobacteraceae bacterium]